MREAAIVSLTTLLSLLVAVAVALTAESGSGDGASAMVPCVTGEAARNEVSPDNGAEMPRHEIFENLAEAEAFLCVHLPKPHVTNDWTGLDHVTVVRSNSLDHFEPGAFSGVDGAFKFARSSFGRWAFIVSEAPVERARLLPGCSYSTTRKNAAHVMGMYLDIRTGNDPYSKGFYRACAAWEKDGIAYEAEMGYPDETDLAHYVLPALESLY